MFIFPGSRMHVWCACMECTKSSFVPKAGLYNIRLPAKYPSIERRSNASISSSTDLSYASLPHYRRHMYASLCTPLLFLPHPTPATTPSHKPLHIVDNERRYSTPINQSLAKHSLYQTPTYLFSPYSSLPLPTSSPPLLKISQMFSPIRNLDSQKYNNTAAAPTCASVLFVSSSASCHGMRLVCMLSRVPV